MDEQKRQALLAMAKGIEDVATAVRSLVVASETVLCGAYRSDWEDDYPCVLPTDHTGNHRDRDGDAF
jgi:hypothetical protein